MKYNHILCIISFLTIIRFSSSDGMSESKQAPAEITPSSKLNKEINDLLLSLKQNLKEENYSSALSIIKQLNKTNNPSVNEKWQKIVLYEFSQTWKNEYFFHNFINGIIKPVNAIINDQSLNKKILLDQLGDFYFVAAAEFFKIIYLTLDAKLKDDYKRIIIDIINTRDIVGGRKQDFIEQFLKPALVIEPSLYNDIFIAITTKYFGKEYPHDFQLIFSEKILKIMYATRIKDNLEGIYALIFLIDISKKNTEDAQAVLLKLYFDNLESIAEEDSRTTRSVFNNITFTKIVIDYLSYNIFVEYFAEHINYLLEKHSSAVIELFGILAHIEKNLIEKYRFDKIFPNIDNQRKKINSAITQNLMHLINNPDIVGILVDILSKSTSLLLKDISLDKVLSIALSHIKQLNPLSAEVLVLRTQSSELARAILVENHFPDDLILLIKDMLGQNLNSPTAIHFKRYQQEAFLNYDSFRYDSDLKNLYQSFRKKEETFNNQGYYTFVHGQMRRFYLPERLYTHLWGLRKHQSVDNFLFAHVKDLVEAPQAQFEEDVTRKTIHMAGTVQESESREVDIERRKKVLFMNYAFFANAQNWGSNSAHYVIDNANAAAGSTIKIPVQEPFFLLGYESIYNKYQNEIEQLAQDYEKLSKYGNMLLIAIPKDKIYKYVYLCKSGGLQRPLRKKDGTQITDIRIAMETLLKNPESLVNSDEIEFCLIMTQVKGGLDPSTGIQIYPLLSGDPEKLKALQEREKILLDKITADVKEQEKQQQLERAAKIAGHVAQSVEAK